MKKNRLTFALFILLFLLAACGRIEADQRSADALPTSNQADISADKSEGPIQQDISDHSDSSLELPADRLMPESPEQQPKETAPQDTQRPEDMSEPEPTPTQEPEPQPDPEPETESDSVSTGLSGSANNTTPTIDEETTDNDIVVYITRTGKRYHYDNHCNGSTYFESTLSEAVSRGLTPCKKCVG